MTLPNDTQPSTPPPVLQTSPVPSQPIAWQPPKYSTGWIKAIGIAALGVAALGGVGVIQNAQAMRADGTIYVKGNDVFAAESPDPDFEDLGTLRPETLQTHDPQTGVPRWYVQFGRALAFVCLPILVLLVIGAVMLMLRKPLARTILLAYAWVYLLFLVVAAASALLAASDFAPTSNFFGQSYQMGFRIGMAVQVAWLAWPAFLLYWFYRRKTREQIATWSAPAA